MTAHAMRVLAMAVALTLGLAVPALAQPTTQREVEESLTCQCGCGLTVHACNHIQCGSGEPIKKEIAERLGRGESKEQILAAFTQKFGEKVLSAPTFRGFNWLAWVTPFAAIVGGGVGVTVVIRRWLRKPPPPPPPSSGAVDDELRRRLQRELDDLDRDA